MKWLMRLVVQRDLKSPDYRTRVAAARKLAAMVDLETAKILVEAFDDSHSDVIQAVSDALLQMGSTGIDALVDALCNSPFPKIRFHAEQTLWKWAEANVDSPDAVGDRFIPLLLDERTDVRRATIHIVGAARDARAVPRLLRIAEKDRNVGTHAIEALGGFADEAMALAAIVAALDRTEWETRRAALRALATRRGDGVPADRVSAALGDTMPEVRREAARALSMFRDGEVVVEPLAKALSDGDAEVRLQAAEGLARFADERALDALAHALKDSQPRVRLLAVQALENMGDAKALGALTRCANDPAPEVKRAVDSALDKLQGRGAA